MIKNIFYILTILAAGATAYFGSVTKSKLTDEIGQTGDLFNKNTLVAKNIQTKEDEIKVSKGERKKAEADRDETFASLENEAGKENGLKRTLGQLEGEIEGYDAELEEIDGAIATAKVLIAQMIPDAPPGLDVDGVVRYIEGLENELKESNAELEEKTEISGKLAKVVSADTTRKENLQGRLGRVKDRIALNGVSASVTGVSNEYGFVIINRGANNSNIDESSKLIVSRGGKLVASLKVASVEPTQTICDIVQSSLKKGQRLRNGDRVTIEVPASN